MSSQPESYEDQLNKSRIQGSVYKMTPSNKKLMLKKSNDQSVLQKMAKSIESYSIKMKKKKKVNFFDSDSESQFKKLKKSSLEIMHALQSQNLQSFQTPSKNLQKRKQIVVKTASEIKLKKIKHDKHYNQLCPICLDQIQQPHAKLHCDHKFCFGCIKFWSESSSKCPCCRKQFKQINDGKQIIKVETKQLMVEDDNIAPCYVCNSIQDLHLLLLCDLCQNYCCHIYCDLNLNNRFPSGDWYCKYCQNESNDDISYQSRQYIQDIQSVENYQSTEQEGSQISLYQTQIVELNNIANRTRSKQSQNNNKNEEGIVKRLRRLRNRN